MNLDRYKKSQLIVLADECVEMLIEAREIIQEAKNELEALKEENRCLKEENKILKEKNTHNNRRANELEMKLKRCKRPQQESYKLLKEKCDYFENMYKESKEAFRKRERKITRKNEKIEKELSRLRKFNVENFKYDFFIAGRNRNKDKILEVCELFKKYNVSYYCFLEEDDFEITQDEFEKLTLDDPLLVEIYEKDLDALVNSQSLLLVNQGGKSSHIESGIAFGMGKEVYQLGKEKVADSLDRICTEIFPSLEELENFLNNYAN